MKYILFFFLLSAPITTDTYAKSLPAAPMVNQLSKARFEVSQKAMEKQIKDPYAELAKFRALPSFGTGFLSGIRVSNFDKDCLLPRFGIKDGDVVEMVNGQPLRTPMDIKEVGEKLAKFKPGAKVRVNVRRGDEDVILNYLLVE